MNRLLSFLLVLPLGGFLSCDQQKAEVSDNLTGTWELVAVYADIGDGNGTYQPVDSDNLLVLRADGTFSANFNFCPSGTSNPDGATGSYSVRDSVLAPNCEEPRLLPFIVEGDTLTVTNPACIEGCGERYLKVSDEATAL